MKLIDEKGRLFGLINLFDLIVFIVAVILVYVGISAFIVLKTPPLIPTSFSPNQGEEGQAFDLTIALDNSRRIEAANLRLIPSIFQGETVLLSAQGVTKRDRKKVVFKIPPTLKTGEYELVLETIVADIIGRNSLLVNPIESNKLAIMPKKIVEAQVERVIDYTWSLEFDFKVTSSVINNTIFQAGNKLSDKTGNVTAEIISTDKANNLKNEIKSGNIIKLKISAQYDELQNFLYKTTNKISFYYGKEIITGYAQKQSSVDLSLIFYIENNSQLEVLKEKNREKAKDGTVQAEITHVFGEQNNAWLDMGQAKTEMNLKQAFSVARTKLSTKLINGNLYYKNAILKPEKFIDLFIEGQKLTAGVLSDQPDHIYLNCNIIIPDIPSRLCQLIKPDLSIFYPSSKTLAGHLRKVLDIQPVLNRQSLVQDKMPDLGDIYKRILINISLNCQIINGQLTFNRQSINYGAQIGFNILGTDLKGYVYQGNNLTTQSDLLILSFNVLFPSVTEELSELIKPGTSILNKGTGKQVGTVQQILDTQPIDIRQELAREKLVDFSNFRRLLLKVSLDCQMENGLLCFNNQPLDYSQKLAFYILDNDLSGYVYRNDHLPSQSRKAWHEVEVLFENVPPEIALLITPDAEEFAENSPVTQKITLVISNEPSNKHQITSDGSYLEIEPSSYRDIRCKVELLVNIEGDQIYYNNNRLVSGGRLIFNARKWTWNARIIKY